MHRAATPRLPTRVSCALVPQRARPDSQPVRRSPAPQPERARSQSPPRWAVRRCSSRLRLRRLQRLDRSAGILPSTEAAANMRDRLQSHMLRRLRGQRRAQAPGAEKYEALVLGKLRLVIGARRIDPEFQHAAWAMEGARDLAVALQFGRIANVDEDDIIAAVQLDGVLDRQILDLAFGRFDQ